MKRESLGCGGLTDGMTGGGVLGSDRELTRISLLVKSPTNSNKQVAFHDSSSLASQPSLVIIIMLTTLSHFEEEPEASEFLDLINSVRSCLTDSLITEILSQLEQ